MHILLNELPLRLNEEEEALKGAAARKLGIPEREIRNLLMKRKSLDARKKNDLLFKYSVAAEVDASAGQALLDQGFQEEKEQAFCYPSHGGEEMKGRALVVGAGPAGLFAAYALAKEGYRPLLLERGKKIGEREGDFSLLQSRGILGEESNACFGEGGAGAFSDGKLTTRIKDPACTEVLRLFVENGAPEEIAYLAKPHLGTDNIRKIVASLREEILRLGGDFLYEAKLADLVIREGELLAVRYEQGGARFEIPTNACVLAVGHSARDTFSMLLERGVTLEKKPFAMGVRVEHPRSFIDELQYGAFAGHPKLGAAEYVLKANFGGRGVYSFCMCPGGEVICSATEAGRTAVNGMSYYKRDGLFSNSALVVSVGAEDMPAGPLGGVELQRQVEEKAYHLAEGYGAPLQRYKDFLAGRLSGSCKSSYLPYGKSAMLGDALPGFVKTDLQKAAFRFDAALPGFVEKGVLIGTETRTSSPLRILRGEEGCSSVRGLYPAGEGSGYAGGIMSSAADGLNTAAKIIARFSEV